MAKKPGRPYQNEWTGKTGLKLNLGCGDHIEEGYINIDIAADCDLKLDLEKAKLPFENESVDEIYAGQIMEHINNFIPLMNECHRVLKSGSGIHGTGKLIIEVPCYPAPECFSDPTHVRVFTQKSFDYFDKRSDLWKRHDYGIEPWSMILKKLTNWNLTAELLK
jgi:SAM-dependent methyltransferase